MLKITTVLLTLFYIKLRNVFFLHTVFKLIVNVYIIW